MSWELKHMGNAGNSINLTNEQKFDSGTPYCTLAGITKRFGAITACQDIHFDRNEGLFSIPVILGTKKALSISSLFHLFSFGFFLAIYFVFHMGAVYLAAVVIIGILFVIQHHLVNPQDLSKINIAFFHINSFISIILFIGILADELIRVYA